MSNLVYLSSTVKDLGPWRTAALEALVSAGYVVKRTVRASDEATVALCLDDVRACDIYVGIFGGYYGWRPDGPGTPSITEQEYDAALKAGKRIFVFTVEKAHWDNLQADGVNGRYDDAKSGDLLRARLTSGKSHTAVPVTNATDLALKVTQALPPAAVATGMFRAPPVHPRQLSTGLLLVGVRGCDDAGLERLRANLPPTWQAGVLLLSPEPASAAADRLQLDAQLARSRCAALLLSPPGLARLAEHPAMAEALPRLLAERLGSYAVLAQGVDAATLPAALPAWAAAPPAAVWPVGQWLADGADVMGGELATLVQQLPACSPSHADVADPGLVGLAWSVLAMTAAEARSLADEPTLVKEELGKKTYEFFCTLTAQPPGAGPWSQRYGPTRRDWQPFGHGSVAALLDDVVQGINQQAVVPKRDHSALLGNEIRLRYYAFEPAAFQPGAPDWPLIEAMRARGCLVLVDELSTLHPALHGTADVFLADPSVTVATLSGLDPAACSLDDVIASPQKIDALVDRFTNKLDPRCELAINSRARARRWLRQSLPEALAGIEAQGPDPARRSAFRSNPGGRL